MKRALLLLMVALPLSGCLGSIPVRVPLVVIEEHLEVISGTAEVDRGWHCDASWYDEGTLRAHLEPYDGPRPRVVFVRPLMGSNGPTASFGSTFAHDAFSGRAASLPSLVGEDRPVANVSWDRTDVRVEGAPLSAGAVTRVVELETSDARVRETMTFRLVGVAEVTTRAMRPWSSCR